MVTILLTRFTQLKKNPKIFITMLLLPLIFTFAFGFSGLDAVKIKIPVIDEDKSALSNELIEEINKTNLYYAFEMDYKEAMNEVSEGKYEVGIIIPNNFSEQLLNNGEPEIKLFAAKSTSVVKSFEGVLIGILQNMQYNVRIVDQSLKSFNEMGLDTDSNKVESRLYKLTAEKWQQTLPVSISMSSINSESKFIYDHKLQTMLGFTLFFSIYTITFSISEILNDRKNGVWDRMIISPLGKLNIYMGNLFYSFSVGFLQIAILVLFSKYFMGVNWGDNLAIIFAVMAVYIFSIMSIGLFLVSLTKTTQQFSAIVPIVAVSFAMLGGAYWPLEIVSSEILLTLAKFIPVTHAMEAIKGVVLYNNGWEAVLQPISILFLIGVIFMGIGMNLIERKAA